MRPGPLAPRVVVGTLALRALAGTVRKTLLGLVLCAAASGQAAGRGALLLLDVPAGSTPLVRKALEGRVLDAGKTKKIESDAAALGLGCAELTDACAAGFGQVAGVDEVVVVTVRPRGGARLVRAARIDSRTARVVDVTLGRLSERAGDGGVAVDVVAGNLFAKTKTPAPVPIAVVVDPPGTPVHIDDRAAALVDGDAWLLPGPHELTVEGQAAAIAKIVVTDRGDPGRVELAVVAPPSLPTTATAGKPVVEVVAASGSAWPAVVTWTGVGIGAVGGLGALGLEGWLALRAPYLGVPTRSRFEQAGQIAAAVGVAGVVVAAVGAGLWWSNP
jgi:hypothetical protein